MSLIVETGAGIAGAESYCTVAFATTYFAGRGGGASVWATYDTPTQEAALRDACDYLTGVYRSRWPGYRANIGVQGLDWPRQLAPKPDQYSEAGGGMGYLGGGRLYYLPTDIPVEVMTAQCDLALRAAISPLTPDIDRVESSIAIGTLKIEYDPSSPINTVFPAVNRKLAPLLKGGGQLTRVARA